MRIDAHQHFWQLERGDYGWMTPDLTPIYRDFGPEDLAPLLSTQGIQGTVLVQAAPTVAETHFMLDIAARWSTVKGVVGWIDFDADDASEAVKALASAPKLVGLRPMIQDIADPDWMLGDHLAPALRAMIEADLTFDALTLPVHLPNLRRFLQRYPDLRVVIDHASKPRIAEGDFDGWAADMTAIANDTDVFVKMSGMITEAGPDWSVESLRPYVAHMLEHFGPDRMIWGSDWPVCRLAGSYEAWCAASDALLSDLSDAQRSAIYGENAVRAYKLRLD